jgi:hypothetical protein
MRRPILWLALAALLVVVYVLYRSRQNEPRLNVEPNAAREIEKAKRR